jgi:hypothetical protein
VFIISYTFRRFQAYDLIIYIRRSSGFESKVVVFNYVLKVAENDGRHKKL